MDQSTTATVATQKARTYIFDNRLPLRTRQAEHDVFLRHDYLDFGGHYFCWCACSRDPGKYHCWHYCHPAYNDQRATKTYIGLFESYEELVPLLEQHGYDHDSQGKIIARLAESYEDGSPGEIVIPEC